jgi:hypothetical protein
MRTPALSAYATCMMRGKRAPAIGAGSFRQLTRRSSRCILGSRLSKRPCKSPAASLAGNRAKPCSAMARPSYTARRSACRRSGNPSANCEPSVFRNVPIRVLPTLRPISPSLLRWRASIAIRFRSIVLVTDPKNQSPAGWSSQGSNGWPVPRATPSEAATPTAADPFRPAAKFFFQADRDSFRRPPRRSSRLSILFHFGSRPCRCCHHRSNDSYQ